MKNVSIYEEKFLRLSEIGKENEKSRKKKEKRLNTENFLTFY